MACHLFSRSELAESNAADLLQCVDEFVATPVGERILRGGDRPHLAEVTNWIAWAGRPRSQKAACDPFRSSLRDR